MAEEIQMELTERTVLGKGLRRLRDSGQVPAVIHDHGKPSMHVAADYIKLNKIYAQAGKHHPVQLKLGGKQHLALIKDVDFEPVKHRLRHIVFQAIKQDEKVTAEIPLVFEDVDIPAEKISLMILKQLDHVEVEALPRDLPDEIMVDPSTLAEVGDKLTVADLRVPAGIAILTDPEMQIAVVEMPKDQIAEAEAAAADLAADAAQAEPAEAAAEPAEPAAESETTEAEA